MAIPLLMLAYAASKRYDQGKRSEQAQAAAAAERNKNADKVWGYNATGSFVAGVNSNSREAIGVTTVTHFSTAGGQPIKLDKQFTPEKVYWDTENNKIVNEKEYGIRMLGSGRETLNPDFSGGESGLRMPATRPANLSDSTLKFAGMTKLDGGINWVPAEIQKTWTKTDEKKRTISWNGQTFDSIDLATQARISDTNVNNQAKSIFVDSGAGKDVQELKSPFSVPSTQEPFYYGDNENPFTTIQAAFAAAKADGNKFPITQMQDGKLEEVFPAEKPDTPDKMSGFMVGKKFFFDIDAAKKHAKSTNQSVQEVTNAQVDEDDNVVKVGTSKLFKVTKPTTEVEQVYVQRDGKFSFVNIDDLSGTEQKDYDAGNLLTRTVKTNEDGSTTASKGERPSNTHQSKNAIDYTNGKFSGVVHKNKDGSPAGFGYKIDSAKKPRDKVNEIVNSVLRNPEAFNSMLATNPTKATQLYSVLSAEVISAYKADQPQFPGDEGALDYDVVSITNDYALKLFPNIANIPGAVNALEKAYDEQINNVKRNVANATVPDTHTVAVLDEVVNVNVNNETVKRRVIMGIGFPKKYNDTVKRLEQKFTMDTIASLMEVSDETIDGIRIAEDNQPILDLVTELYSTPFYYMDSQNKKVQGSLFDAFMSEITPDGSKYFQSIKVSRGDSENIADIFMEATQNNPAAGIRLIKNLAPLNKTISKRILKNRYDSTNLDKIQDASFSSAKAAQTAFGTLNNIRGSFFMPSPDGTPDLNRPLDMTMAVADVVLKADGLFYVVEKAQELISKGLKGTIISPENIPEAGQRAFLSARVHIMSPEQAAKSVEEGGRGQDADANRQAADRNRKLYDSIIADMQSDEMITVKGNDGKDIRVAKKLLASRRLYKYLAAYQMAAAIQGGTGGRTISDQDVENMLQAFNFTTYTTPEAELATIDAAMGMMKRIRDVGSAIGSRTDPTAVFAGITYETLELNASPDKSLTIYKDILDASDYLKQPGAEKRSTLGENSSGTPTNKITEKQGQNINRQLAFDNKSPMDSNKFTVEQLLDKYPDLGQKILDSMGIKYVISKD